MNGLFEGCTSRFEDFLVVFHSFFVISLSAMLGVAGASCLFTFRNISVRCISTLA